MKKITAFLMSALMLVLCLTGCGGREEYAGKWEASEMVLNNKTIKDLSGIPLNAVMRFELDKNGSAEWVKPFDSVSDPSKDGISAHWKVKDGKIILTVSQPDTDDKVMNFEYRDDKLVLEQSGAEISLVRVNDYTPVDENAMNQLFANSFDFSSLMGS